MSICFKALALIVAVAAIAFTRISNSVQQSDEVLEPSSAAFRIRDADMWATQTRARGGDCNAALRIGRHHSYWTHDWTQAVNWFRLAARCPDASVKGEFINILLYTVSDYSLVSTEVDSVLAEMEALDPKYYADIFQPVLDSHGYHRKNKLK